MLFGFMQELELMAKVEFNYEQFPLGGDPEDPKGYAKRKEAGEFSPCSESGGGLPVYKENGKTSKIWASGTVRRVADGLTDKASSRAKKINARSAAVKRGIRSGRCAAFVAARPTAQSTTRSASSDSATQGRCGSRGAGGPALLG